ncbi:Lrp/AsnC family transcriptional regulator [Mesorhizobium sp. M2C.T.Ca.TU.002.02.1.1]|jgi:Lrp/AsnC family leucine-responsive transcriptional regulator|uniref:DNA-binding transcriptional dual regulator, leucine-binding n=1 Tax=Mesorhizobium plurifarium TaxID=69974 RepID=A0A090FWV5_MESPL|nr:Lrp/AsnC family transcriptional regulator [Mesorhizobium sp. M2C.T.Ca.TU.002.02.1.1]RUU69915.1 Lrp/AsnC family transcriptional regulator [Mesorhizobium sp. M2C.T.Ca.TU.009.01.2.1]CDX35998.1 DNA-binding transcriptional dual regulator, leucine-binding [Mesorhizobium plurifarium]RUU50539.1 Lrp/AsnC family transcriptional regulator [Mesorhizobium sp. M2C.T.Ca.TU.002.02.1.1]CDX51354.1 DNA-binding transcriptional dual regulator, leucine-binding [Mesorhizobium plurifarium]CDX60433.1 DNA-binding tr
MVPLDAIDHRILRELRQDGRISTVDLAERVGLSPTPCARRLKRLEETGVIQGYAARIDPAALGLGVCVMVSVRLGQQGPEGAGLFLDEVAKHPEITECLLVTGNIDYLLRVWVKDIAALREFISNVLQSIPSVAETSTMVVLNPDETNL